MKISKEYRWEMGHRILNHNGLCRNVHGHSYKMIVEVEGEIGKNGMIIDFYELSKIVKPVVEKLDHCFLCETMDNDMVNFLANHKMKYLVMDFESTVENVSKYLANLFTAKLSKKRHSNIKSVTVKLYETPNSHSECTVEM